MAPVDEQFNEGSLIQQVQVGTLTQAQAAFTRLVTRHAAHLLNYLQSKGLTVQEANDIASETWLRAWRKISQFEYRGIDLFPWLRQIANFIIKEQIRSKYRYDLTIEDIDTKEITSASSESQIIEQINHKSVKEVIEGLLVNAPDDYKKVIEAEFFMDFSPKEIGQLFDWSMSKVYTTKFRALTWLKQKLSEQYADDIIRDWLT